MGELRNKKETVVGRL